MDPVNEGEELLYVRIRQNRGSRELLRVEVSDDRQMKARYYAGALGMPKNVSLNTKSESSCDHWTGGFVAWAKLYQSIRVDAVGC